MITYINKDNADKYRVLFANAVKDLKTHNMNGESIFDEKGLVIDFPVIEDKVTYQKTDVTAEEYGEGGIYYILEGDIWRLTEKDEPYNETAIYGVRIESDETISTLEEYFSYIEQLQKINKKYTVLPLDEDIFEINANTRVINVPKTFKDNGISVEGDEVAEILYFKINRFFDVDDLAMKSIAIQWKSADGTEGVSAPWIVNTDIIPGYVLFGWPLSTEITQTPGKVEFAVRFYTYDEQDGKGGKIKYSLSTLVASADIKTSLNYNLKNLIMDGNIVDVNQLIMDRIENSDTHDGSSPDPLPPVITVGLAGEEGVKASLLGAFDVEEVETEDGKRTLWYVYLTDTTTGEEKDAKYRVQATSEDGGVIGYIWDKRDINDEYAEESLVTDFVFEITDDEVYDKHKVYYVKESDNVYTPYVYQGTSTDMIDVILEIGKDLYERYSETTINSTGADVLGSYRPRFSNRLGRKLAREYGIEVILIGPAKPVVTKTITENDNILNDEDYSLVLEVAAETDEHAYITYSWKRRRPDSDEFVLVDETTVPKLIVEGKSYDDLDSANDLSDGYYSVVVEAKLNSAVETSDSEEQILRVTHPASAVSIKSSISDLPGGAFEIGTPIEIVVTPNEKEFRTAEDNIAYQWYRYEIPTNGSLADDLVAAGNGEYVRKVNDKIIQNATSNILNIVNTSGNENGYYFCEVTNNYNGSKHVQCSNFFNVIDSEVAARLLG